MASEKVVSVRLQAKVEGFTAGMRKAKLSVDDLTKADVPKAAKAYGDLANKAALAGTAIAVGLGVAVKRFAEFDATMSAVQSNTSGTVDELNALRAAALKLGADSQFSATEAAQGVNELAKAGVATADVLNGGLKGALDLAAAGQIEVAQAAETTATAMTQFKLGGDQAVHVADLLAAGANKAQGGVGDLGQALQQSGLVAAATGLTIEETTAGLTAFASAGLIGSDAGTSFKTMLQRLSAPSGEAAALMKELGISAYDSSGNFVGLEAVAGQLRTSLEGLTPAQRNAAQATIFGSDAVRASNILYEQGSEGIAKWTREVDQQGFAAKQAADLTDNLTGDIERLGGAFDSVLIETGSGANASLRTLTQGLTGLVEVIGKVPGPLLLAGGGLATIALALPKGIIAWRSYKASLDATGLSLDKIRAKSAATAASISALQKALAILAVAEVANQLAQFAPGAQAATVESEKLRKSLVGLADGADAVGLKELFQGSGLFSRDVNSAQDALDAFADSATVALGQNLADKFDRLGTFGQPAEKFAGQIRQIDTELAALVASGNADQAKAAYDRFIGAVETANERGAQIPLGQVKSSFEQYASSLDEGAAAADSAADSGSNLIKTTDEMAVAAEDAKKAMDDLRTAIEGLGSPVAQARAAQRDFQSSLNDSDDALNTYRESLIAKAVADGKSESAAKKWADAQIAAGRALKDTSDEALGVQASLDDIREATLAKVLADYELTGSTEDATDAMKKGRKEFIDAATEAGLTKKQAKELADQLGLIPDNVEILVKQSGADTAAAEIAAAAVDRTSTIWVTSRFRSTDLSSEFQGVGGRAGGGGIWGAGTKTSDSIPIWASNGEFMQKAAAVDKYGLSFMNAVNSLQFPTELARGYRDGGQIQPQQYAPRVQVVQVPSSGGPNLETRSYDQRVMPSVMNVYENGSAGVRQEAEATRWKRSARGAL